MIGRFGNTFAKLHSISKPTVAVVQGWCIAGGTDMGLKTDLIVSAQSAQFGYPPARVCCVPEAPWLSVSRLGLERAKRYLFTGDELTVTEAAEAGMVLACVPDHDLRSHADALAQRIVLLPLNQLQMMKWMLNDFALYQYQPTRVASWGRLRRRRPPHAGTPRLRRTRPADRLARGRPRA